MKNKRARVRDYVILTSFEGSISFNPISKSRYFEFVGLCTFLITMRFDPRYDKETSSYTVLITVAHVGDRKESARKSIRSHLLNGCHWNAFAWSSKRFRSESIGIDQGRIYGTSRSRWPMRNDPAAAKWIITTLRLSTSTYLACLGIANAYLASITRLLIKEDRERTEGPCNRTMII